MKKIKEELLQALEVGDLAPTIRALSERGVLKDILPEIEALKGVEQSPQYHSEGDVYVHTLLVLENAQKTPIVQLAALLHDTGKPSTQEILPDRIRFLGHEDVSVDIARRVLQRLGLNNYVEPVCLVVGWHMRINQSLRWKTRTVRKFVREIREYQEEALALADADAAGSLGPDSLPAKIGPEKLRQRILALDDEPLLKLQGIPLPLSGNDVMRILGVGPGPEVGKALRWLQERIQGVFVSSEEAEGLLRREYLSDIGTD